MTFCHLPRAATQQLAGSRRQTVDGRVIALCRLLGTAGRRRSVHLRSLKSCQVSCGPLITHRRIGILRLRGRTIPATQEPRCVLAGSPLLCVSRRIILLPSPVPLTWETLACSISVASVRGWNVRSKRTNPDQQTRSIQSRRWKLQPRLCLLSIAYSACVSVWKPSQMEHLEAVTDRA